MSIVKDNAGIDKQLDEEKREMKIVWREGTAQTFIFSPTNSKRNCTRVNKQKENLIETCI